ncbi:MAG: nucleotidyltransferase family protein, partial [Desulfobacteraceae bacterium]
MENTARNMRMVNDLERICSELDRQGLSYIAYKGPVGGMLGYNDIALRQFSDLDLMIRHQEFDRVLRFFGEMGFDIPQGSRKKVIDYTGKSWRDIGASKGNLHIDLHQMMAKGPCFFRPFDETWENCVGVKLNRDTVQTFSIEDSLVVHSINNAKDGFSSLRQFRDIAGLMQEAGDIDWDRVVLIAEKRKSLTILLVSVKLAHLFCGAALPESIRVLTERRSVERKVKFYVDRLFSTGFNVDILSWYLTVPACLDTVLSKFRFYAWFASNPAPQVHPEMFRLPGYLFFLFPVLQPFNLLFRYGRAVFLKGPGETRHG